MVTVRTGDAELGRLPGCTEREHRGCLAVAIPAGLVLAWSVFLCSTPFPQGTLSLVEILLFDASIAPDETVQSTSEEIEGDDQRIADALDEGDRSGDAQ